MRGLRPLIPLVLLVATLNFIISDRFYQRVMIMTLIWAIAAMSWNLTAKAGQISLGHSAFTGIGAYTFVFLNVYLGWSPWIGMFVGMAVAAVAAVVIGLPSFKLEGFYFTLATIAYPLILMLLVINFGFAEVTVPYQPDREWFAMQFRDQSTWIWLLLGMLVLVIVGQHMIDRSRFGYSLRAIRDNQILAEAVGIRSSRRKLAAFALSAAIAAAVAVPWVNAILFLVDAEQVFGLIVVIQMLSFVFVGGIASLWGPVVGAGLLVPLAMTLADRVGDQFPGVEALMYGMALVIVALLMPEGIVWRVRSILAKRRGLDIPVEAAEGVVIEDVPEVPATPPAAESEPREPQPSAPSNPPIRIGATTTRTAQEPLLQVRGVNRYFGGLRALADVDLDLHVGPMVGIIGPNGAGKTTLFNVLTGFLRPSSGSVAFQGEEITGLRPPDRYVAGISRTFQVPQGFQRMTPYENVLVAAYGAGLDEAEDRAHATLAAVGLGDAANVELSSLTTLQVKLLEVARAVVSEPRLLLVDEPLAGLNGNERDDLLVLLRQLGDDRGSTVVVIEHSVRSLVRSVDRVVALHEGAILTDGAPADVVADPRVIRSYLGRRWEAVADSSESQG